jgi:hypothetical protein
MEIQKASVSAPNPSTSLRRRERVEANAHPEEIELSPVATAQSSVAKQDRSAEIEAQREFAIRQLESLRASNEEDVGPFPASVKSARAREALTAYQVQLSLPQDETQSSLRQMLGVDFFA